jgi:hypothetical protein
MVFMWRPLCCRALISQAVGRYQPWMMHQPPLLALLPSLLLSRQQLLPLMCWAPPLQLPV